MYLFLVEMHKYIYTHVIYMHNKSIIYFINKKLYHFDNFFNPIDWQYWRYSFPYLLLKVRKREIERERGWKRKYREILVLSIEPEMKIAFVRWQSTKRTITTSILMKYRTIKSRKWTANKKAVIKGYIMYENRQRG